MKKQYINPTTIILEIKTTQMIASSAFTPETKDVPVQPGSATEWGSRKGPNVWDDEEEDEEDFY